MKRNVLLVTVLIFCALLAGCAADSGDVALVMEAASVSGGDADLGDGINLKDIGIEMQGKKTVISLSFISGSRVAGVNEAKVSSVPIYTVSVLPAPARLKVQINADYTDYTDKSEVFAESIVYGMFKTSNGGGKTVYFQLSEEVEAEVSTMESTLQIVLTPREEPSYDAYFARLDAFSEYDQNIIAGDEGYTPTLCEELTATTLISQPFLSENEAQEFADESAKKLKGTTTAIPIVFEMNTKSLPIALQVDEESNATKAPVFETEEQPGNLEVVLPDGRYLCKMPTGEIIYARSYLPESGEDMEQVLMEKLWVKSGDGQGQKLGTKDFYGVEEAAVSASGQYLAILDSGVENKVLYVYDLQAGELRNLGEEGFGDLTTSFAWDDTADIIYAMTGYNALQLTTYDFSKPEYERVSSIEEQNGADSNIKIAAGKIYFADKDAEEFGVVYKVDLQTAQREAVAEGIEFDVTGDGKYVATLLEEPQDEYSVAYMLELVNLQEDNGEPVHIAQNILNFAFGADDRTLYYTVQSDEQVEGEYQYELMKYDIGTGDHVALGYTKSGIFVPAGVPGQVYLIDYVMQASDSFYVTYIYTEE